MVKALTTSVPRREKLSDTVRAGNDVEAMRNTAGWKALMETIEAREQALVGELTAIKAENVNDYARLVGEIAGLRSVDAVARGIVKVGKAAAESARRIEERSENRD